MRFVVKEIFKRVWQNLFNYVYNDSAANIPKKMRRKLRTCHICSLAADRMEKIHTRYSCQRKDKGLHGLEICCRCSWPVLGLFLC